MNLRWGLLLVAPAILIGCVFDASHRSSNNNNNTNNTTNNPPQPILAVISTDKTMSAKGGDGVGVFVEYQKGGTWHVTWTCDTNRSRQSCNFDVKISALTGSISNLQPDHLLATDKAAIGADGTLAVNANTGSNVAGITFTTGAGARIRLDASVAGIDKTGDYIFFVATNSKGEDSINGDYMGVLTNPLFLEPSLP